MMDPLSPIPSGGSPAPVLAHAGGIDEMLFVLVPLLVFLTLQWLNRRKRARSDVPAEDMTTSLERRRRLAGGLIAEPTDPQESNPEGKGPPEQDRSLRRLRQPPPRRGPGSHDHYGDLVRAVFSGWRERYPRGDRPVRGAGPSNGERHLPGRDSRPRDRDARRWGPSPAPGRAGMGKPRRLRHLPG